MPFPRISRRHLLQGTAATRAGHDAAGARRVRQGYRRRLHLCRLARRLRLQPGARRRRRRAEEDARHQGGRGGEGPGNRRGREDHGVHDQSRRRHAAVPDLVRLLQPAHAQAGQRSIPKLRFEHAAACGPRRTRRTSAAISAISTRRNTSPASSPATPPRPASSASSPPSRSRRCCATSTPSCSARRLANPNATTQVIFTGDWSMPVKEAEATNSLSTRASTSSPATSTARRR